MKRSKRALTRSIVALCMLFCATHVMAADSNVVRVGVLKIGVAGGPLDKRWLLLQGMAQQENELDVATENDIAFGAPPLLAEKARDGELGAVLNYWHFSENHARYLGSAFGIAR